MGLNITTTMKPNIKIFLIYFSANRVPHIHDKAT